MFFLLLLSIPCLLQSESICSNLPAPSGLAAVSVWVRHDNFSSLFRISDEDLTDEGYQRSPADRENFVVLLAREPGECPTGPCALKLSRYRRIKDGAVIQQESVFGIPKGFEAVQDDIYCARSMGDCGADVPIFRLTRGRGNNQVSAYSLDSSSSISGYIRDKTPICYGWSDAGSIVHKQSAELNCLSINTIANAKITYSTVGSGAYGIGTTATLQCEEGYAAGGQSALLCTKSGWYPATGLGYCVKQGSGATSGSISKVMMCAAPASIENGHIMFSLLESEGRFPSGTTGTVMCDFGATPTSSDEVKCEKGKWTKEWPMCIRATDITCPPFLPTLNGKVIYTSENSSSNPFAVGSTATLKCDIGYETSGPSITQCEMHGWTPATLGPCAMIVRRKRQAASLGCSPIFALGGKANYIQSNPQVPYSSGSSVLLTCDTGYSLQGSPSSLCMNGAWTPQIGSCVFGSTGTGGSTGGLNTGNSGANCVDFPTPANGVTSYSLPSNGIGSHPSGSMATLSCNLGFTVSGALSSMCSNGVWSPSTLGTCNSGMTSTLGECTNPVVANGMITFSQGTSLETKKPSGTVATVVCNLGFTASGSTSSTCSFGVWSPALPTCTMGSSNTGSQQCFSGILPPLYGTITYSSGNSLGPFQSGTTATVKCNNGATPTGTSMSTCQSGTWSPASLGTCSLSNTGTTGSCTSIGSPIGGMVSYSNGGVIGPFPAGTTATVKCIDTSKSVQGSSISSCVNGQWQPSTLGTCSSSSGVGGSAQCFMIGTPLGATVKYSTDSIFGPFPSGTIATTQCPAGQSSQGTSTSTCVNGNWQPSTLSGCSSSSTPGTGTGNSCTALVQPINGQIQYSSGSSNSFPLGTTATLTCTSGTPTGSSFSSCINGVWTPTIGSCSNNNLNGQTQCLMAPTTLLGATVKYSSGNVFGPWNSGTTATLQCPTGQFAQGASTSTCQNGVWTALATSCSTTSNSGDSNTGCLPLAGFSSQMTNGYATYFPSPTSRVSVGTVAILKCSPGFTPSGSTSSSCTSQGWNPSSLGQCITQGSSGTSQCSNIMNPTNGAVAFSQTSINGMYSSGTMAQLNCNLGYTVTGSSSSSCINGQWSPQLGSCQAGIGGSTGTQCFFGLSPVLNGAISYSTGATTGPWNAGTMATLQCNANYITSGTSMSTCVNGQWSPSSMGSCQMSGSGPSQGQCQAIPAIASGTIQYSQFQAPPYNEGTTATLFCNLGTVVSGQSTVTCRSGGWSPFPGLGTCHSSLSRAPVKKVQASVAKISSSCPVPMTPPFGEITFSNPVVQNELMAETVAVLHCVLGYTVVGESSSICQNGAFRPLLGSCSNGLAPALPGACLPLSVPKHGKIQYIQSSKVTNLEVGSTALLSCESTFAITGVATLSCGHDGWEPSNGFGTCDPTNDV